MSIIAKTGKFDDVKGTLAAYLDTMDTKIWFSSYAEELGIDISRFNIEAIEAFFIGSNKIILKFHCLDNITSEIEKLDD